MNSRRFLLHVMLAFSPAAFCAAGEGPSNEPARYSGLSDASAAVALDAKTFIVADDEKNIVNVYRTDPAGGPVHSFPWGRNLGIDPQDEHPEVDIEGATVLDGRIYWIASHGRNRDGRWRPSRHRFFAMTVRSTGDEISAEPFGKPCKTLIISLVGDQRMQDLGLANALGLGHEQVKRLAPKKQGLNIEGLAAMPDGQSLLIAFRNPLADGKTLLVPLENPAAVLEDEAAPQFGQPTQLTLAADLDGELVSFGIRGIEYSPRHAAYLIVAGPNDTRKRFAVFRWSGIDGAPALQLPRSTARINGTEAFTPEALIVYPQRSQVQLLSDDGTLEVEVESPAECMSGAFNNGRCQAKFLLDDTRKTFRSMWIEVE